MLLNLVNILAVLTVVLLVLQIVLSMCGTVQKMRLSLRRRSILLNVVLRVLILISLFVLRNVQGWCKLSVYF